MQLQEVSNRQSAAGLTREDAAPRSDSRRQRDCRSYGAPLRRPTSGPGHGHTALAQHVCRLGRRDGNRVVLLDAAPCLSTSDPAALAPVVGQILMVVQAERTQREEVESALELLQACPSIMLVLNRAHPWNRHTFGGYSSDYSS